MKGKDGVFSSIDLNTPFLPAYYPIFFSAPA